MSILLFILALLCVVVAVAGVFMSKSGSDLGKPVALGASVLVIILVILNLLPGKSAIKEVTNLQERFDQLCGEQMGRYLTENYPGKRVLIVIEPQNDNNPGSANMGGIVEALEDTLSKDMAQVDTLALERPAAFQAKIDKIINASPEAYPQGEFDYFHGMPAYHSWFDLPELNKLVQSKADSYDFIVLAIELSFEITNLGEAKGKEMPKLALLNTSPAHAAKGLKKGFIAAAITYQPNPEAWQRLNDIPKDDLAAFEKRYILLTPERFTEVAGQYPKYFKN